MNFVPLIVMNGILLIITLLLALADRLLVTYGTCRLTVTRGDDRTDMEVEGGGTLLTILTEQGVELSDGPPQVVGEFG